MRALGCQKKAGDQEAYSPQELELPVRGEQLASFRADSDLGITDPGICLVTWSLDLGEVGLIIRVDDVGMHRAVGGREKNGIIEFASG